jgi:hypothetical protein
MNNLKAAVDRRSEAINLVTDETDEMNDCARRRRLIESARLASVAACLIERQWRAVKQL